MAENIRSDNDQKDQDRSKLLWFLTTVSLCTVPIFAFVYMRLGSPGSARALLYTIPFFLVAYLIESKLHRFTLAANWVIALGYFIFGAVSYYTGGLESPALMWSLCIPIVAVVVCGVRSGLVWLALVLAQFLLFFEFNQHGIGYQEIDAPSMLHLAFLINRCGVILFTFALAAMVEFQRQRYLRHIEESNKKLKEALENVQTLSGLLPMCAWCKKIRNDKGYWDQIETYVSKHATVSHGICPECAAKQTQAWKRQEAGEGEA